MMLTADILAAAELSWASVVFNIVLLLVLVTLSGTFSGSETVLFSLSRLQLERAAASHNPFRRLAATLMQQPKRTLLTILLANTAVNVLLFAVSYVFFHRLAARIDAVWLTPVTGVASILLVVVCGEVVPKVVGVSLADRLAPVSAGIVRFVDVVAAPIGRAIDFLIAEPFLRIVLGGHHQRRPSDAELSATELKTVLEMSRRSGGLKALEDTFLRPIVDLGTTRVADVMTPRVDIVAYDVNRPPAGLRDLIRETGYRKVPVFESDLDNVVGLIYAKVLFLTPDRPLRSFVQPVHFVPALATCEHLLQHFRETRSQIAIAVDEYGGVAGLVTLEDVTEQIVGELYDPEDEPESPDIQALPNSQYDISGQLGVKYFVEAFKLPARVERVATVGGLVMAKLGRLARVGDVVRFGNIELRVTRLRRRTIDRLHLRLIHPHGAEGEGGAS